MSDILQSWPVDAFDAINIYMHGGHFNIIASDGDQVELEGDSGDPADYDFSPEVAGRWLQIHQWYDSDSQPNFTLRLPKQKAWVLDLYAWHGKAEIAGLSGRLQISLQKGDITVSDCQGQFFVTSSSGNVELTRCSEAQAPERPPQPQNTDSPVHQNQPFPKDIFSNGPWDWISWSPEEWTDWGMRFGEKASKWAQQFASFWDHMGWDHNKAGIFLHSANGDVHLEEIDATVCGVSLAKGNIEFNRGRVTYLKASTSHGDIECKSLLPDGGWSLRTSHGNVKLSLPADTRARLDAATRHGNIHSNVPLVRVSRPGPESRNGGRMVGTLGSTEGNTIEISMSTLHGDIEINLEQTRSAYASRPETRQAAQASPVNSAPAEPSAAEGNDNQDTNAVESNASTPDPQLAILQALSEGTISVEEAEHLLNNLKQQSRP
jgi:hypothetical protein